MRAKLGAAITRDALDQLLLGKDGEGGQYHDGTGTIIDNENQVGNWPEPPANTPPIDTDGDGIPGDGEPVTGLLDVGKNQRGLGMGSGMVDRWF